MTFTAKEALLIEVTLITNNLCVGKDFRNLASGMREVKDKAR